MTARRGVTDQAAAAAVEQGCRLLRLPTIRDRFSEIAASSEREQLSYLGFLAELVMAECDDRDRRRAARRVHEAGFPRPKLLSEFSFDANPAINPAVIGQLATCGWVKAGHPLCLIGDSGTGKTHLLIALGTLAANLTGGLLMGCVMGLFDHFQTLSPALRLFVFTGFLGGLTTFSTFSAESATLLLRQQYLWFSGHVVVHVVGSLALTVLGISLTRSLLRHA